MSSRTAENRWISLLVLCTGMLMVVLDSTVVNIALPSIQSDLGFSASSLAWVVNAYMIAFGGLLLLSGRLGDLIGSKRVFIAGIAVFTVASLLCGLAPSQALLIGARFLQGVGGAMASSVILAMIVTMFTEPAERARAMGIFSFTASAGGSVGLLVGGAITQVMSWHWVFLINVPIGIAAVVAAARFLRTDSGIGLGAGADVAGSLLITAALMDAVYTVVQIPEAGISGRQTLLLGSLAVLLFVAFLWRESTARNPLMPLGLFKSRAVAGSNVLQVLIVAGMFGFFFLDSLYLRRVLGYGPVATGLAFLPVTIGIGAFSLGWSAQITMRFGPYRVLAAGTAAAAIGLSVIALAPMQSNYFTTLLPAITLLGVGLGVSFPSLMMFAMADAGPDTSGLVSGLVNTTAQVGGAFGLAIFATSAAWKTHASLAAGLPAADAMSAGDHFAFLLAAGCLIAATIVAALVFKGIDIDTGADAAEGAAA